MKIKKIVLAIIATGVGITSAFAAYAYSVLQVSYYIKDGTTIRQITFPNGTFFGCTGSGNTCRVKVIRPDGNVVTESTTVYANPAATIIYASSVVISGTVVMP